VGGAIERSKASLQMDGGREKIGLVQSGIRCVQMVESMDGSRKKMIETS
jgi:hypothetical protein